MAEASWFSISTLKMLCYIIGLGRVFLTEQEQDVYNHCWTYRAIYMARNGDSRRGAPTLVGRSANEL